MTIAEPLRAAIQGGDWSIMRGRLAPEAVLHTSNQAGRQSIAGAAAVTDHLSRPGAGEVHDWHVEEWPTGVALSFEWEGASGRDRRRWYVRRNDAGAVVEIWSVAARPSADGGGETATAPPALLAQLHANEVRPLRHGGNSGATLLHVTGDDAAYVLKRVSADGADWLARVTKDRGRTAQLHDDGAFERMPPAIGHGIVAVEHADGAAWIAMRDVKAQLLPADARLSREQSRIILHAAADLHRTFYDRVPSGAAALADRLAMNTPAVADAERRNPDLLPKQFEQGWDAFAELVPADVAGAVLGYVSDPQALADALLRAHDAPTLIHGDLRGDNLGFDDHRLVLIDWDLATAGTPTTEFAWYLAHSARRIDATHEQIESDHRAAHGDQLSAAELELGMLSGLVQYGWRIAHSARIHADPAETAWGQSELKWWVPRVRHALEKLGGPPS